MPTDPVYRAVSNLSNGEKYNLLYHHVKPPTVLPSTNVQGKNRKFNVSWLEKYSWLLYSPKVDGVFCGPCSILLSSSDRADKGLLVNKSLSNWAKLSNTLSSHSSLRYHRDCVLKVDVLKTTVEIPSSCINVMINSSLQKRMNENRHIICQIVRAVIYLAKQGLPLRGDVEDINGVKNPGHFLALLKDYASKDEILYQHLHFPKAINATYMSSTTQNDIINVIGYDLLLNTIISEVKEATFFSVLANEVSSHNVEHLAMCLRFVDSECNIRKEFVAFIKLSRVRASDIADSILTTLVNLGLSMSDLRGQGYDGASTMRGAKAGVQAQIRERQPMALYTHCAGHSLNLAILSSCSIPCISNCIDQIKSLTLFVKHSPKREGLLKAIVSKNTEHTSNRSPLLNVCVTRWIENIDGWERFSTAHPFLVKMCEVILYGDPDYPVYNDNWPAEDKKNALAYLKALECFEFIYCLVTLSRTLLYLKNAVVKIQGVDQDIVSGVCSVMENCKELESVRKDVDNFSKRIFDHSSRIAEISGVSVSMPRVSMHQT